MKRETRSCALQVKASGADGSIVGYGSVFNNADSYDDVIVGGAFVKSLAAHKQSGTMPAMLWQHNSDEPIGVWEEIAEDEHGLLVRGRLAMETARGKEAHALLKMGAINGLSIGFMTKQSSRNQAGVRTLTELDLWEVSLVTFPANQRARITQVKAADVDAIDTIRKAEEALRDAGFSADAAKAFLAKVKRFAVDERDAQEQQEALQAAQKLLRLFET